MIDYHLHTPRCRHAQGEPREYLEKALQLGLREIGFADHFPLKLLGVDPEIKVSTEPEELPLYVQDILNLSDAQYGPKVKLGIEADFLPGTESILKKTLAGYPFDYVLGSVHFMGSWDFSHPVYVEEFERRNLRDIYRDYFTLVWEACRSRLFDIIAHPDVIKKFGHLYPGDLEDYWQETALQLKETDTCLELNTAGRDAPVKKFYPASRLVEICRERGVAVTLGSDAHAPEQVGRYFDEARQVLVQAGYRAVAVFNGRRRDSLSLEEL